MVFYVQLISYFDFPLLHLSYNSFDMSASLTFSETIIRDTADRKSIWLLVSLAWADHCDQDMCGYMSLMSGDTTNETVTFWLEQYAAKISPIN